MKNKLIFVLMLCVGVASADAITDKLTAKFLELGVRRVEKSPLPNIYELVLSDRIVYTDGEGRYLIVGSLIDADSKVNLTQAKVRKIGAVKFSDIPLRKAIKRVKGNGSRTLVVLSDPMCPYCKELEKTLSKMDNLTTYILPLPREDQHRGTTALSVSLWCASNPAEAWDAYMLRDVAPQSAVCNVPLKDVADFANKNDMQGTPNIIFKDGAVVRGGLPQAVLEQWLKDTPK